MQERDTRVTNIATATATPSVAVPFYSIHPAAGFPAPGDDVVEQPLDLTDFLVDNHTATFYVRVSGDSMEGLRIFDGDILVVDRSITAADRSIVVAAVYGELVVKELRQTGTGAQLFSAQEGYEPIVVADADDVFIWGVVTGSVRKLRS